VKAAPEAESGHPVALCNDVKKLISSCRSVQFRFAPKASHAVGVTREGFRENLDGYVTAKLGITGSVDFSHSVRANS
jgi:hypothetical protein